MTMNVKTTKFSEQQTYAAPEITPVDMVTDSILCSSTRTEKLIEDDYNPWG